MTKKKIVVIGLGYIGLPTSVLIANAGYEVLGYDINEAIVKNLNKGILHIREPGLEKNLKRAIKNKKFIAHSKIQKGDVYIICVPTPIKKINNLNTPDIDFVVKAAREISSILKDEDLIILESTCPVGTLEKVNQIFQENRVKTNKIHLAYCPERVLPGKMMQELIYNERIIGGFARESSNKIANFYKSFTKSKISITDARTAEMCKLTENSFRDINIAFANEISNICDREKINVWELINLANKHPRVNILQPGIGVGGHCIAVDPWFIIYRNRNQANLIKNARSTNLSKTKSVINKIKNFSKSMKKSKMNKSIKIICLGLSYKPDIDDLRESPAVNIVETLTNDGYKIKAVEPHIKFHPKIKLTNINAIFEDNIIVVVLVPHTQFGKSKYLKRLKLINTLDFCGLLNSDKR